MRLGPLSIDLGWIIQRVDSPELQRRNSPPLQRMRKEDMIMMQQEQQGISVDQVPVARAMLKVCKVHTPVVSLPRPGSPLVTKPCGSDPQK